MTKNKNLSRISLLRSYIGLKGFFVLIILVCFSSCGINARIKKADKKYEIGEYYAAGEMYRSSFYRISYKERKLRSEVAFKQGECYRKINYYRAPMAYQNAVRNKYQDSIVYLRWAQTLQYGGKYSDAAKQYKVYLETYPDSKVAQDGLEACLQVAQWRKKPTRYKVAQVKEFDERRTSAFSPVFIGESADALAFTSTRATNAQTKKKNSITGMGNNRIFTTRKNATGKWEKPEVLTNVNSETTNIDQGTTSFTSDGRTMYFTRAQSIQGQDKGTEICMSKRAGGEWSEPQMVKLFEDSTISVAHPTISANGEILYFVSDAPGGCGGTDIWMANKGLDSWENVSNLGENINTSEDEKFPTLRNDTTLYFSSTGHAGYGGLDLFKATRTADKDWQILNMGIPFNSNSDDFGITFAGEAEAGFFSSNRNDKSGYDKIYAFELPEQIFVLEGKVSAVNGDTLETSSVRMVGNDGTNAKIQTRKDGTFRLKLNKNVSYVMLGSSRGYLNQKQELSLPDLQKSKTYRVDFQLSPINKPVTMENVFYEFGKWDITPASAQALNELVKLLEQNQNITIELSAHSDQVGDAATNKELSEKRAQSVVDFLIKNGIESDRLTPVGYGQEKPVVADKSLNKKFPFIPIGQELNEQFVNSLPAAQQETANQINRRTEFKVLKTTYNLY